MKCEPYNKYSFVFGAPSRVTVYIPEKLGEIARRRFRLASEELYAFRDLDRRSVATSRSVLYAALSRRMLRGVLSSLRRRNPALACRARHREVNNHKDAGVNAIVARYGRPAGAFRGVCEIYFPSPPRLPPPSRLPLPSEARLAPTSYPRLCFRSTPQIGART